MKLLLGIALLYIAVMCVVKVTDCDNHGQMQSWYRASKITLAIMIWLIMVLSSITLIAMEMERMAPCTN